MESTANIVSDDSRHQMKLDLDKQIDKASVR